MRFWRRGSSRRSLADRQFAFGKFLEVARTAHQHTGVDIIARLQSGTEVTVLYLTAIQHSFCHHISFVISKRTPMKPIRILVVDDHEVMRMGVRMLCTSHPDWQICDEASNGEEAIRKIQECLPDLVILDLCLSGLINGFNVATEIREIAPKTKIIIYSLNEVPFRARRSGADAFVAKSSGAAGLSAAIEQLVERPQSEAVEQAEVQRLGPFDFFRQSRR